MPAGRTITHMHERMARHRLPVLLAAPLLGACMSGSPAATTAKPFTATVNPSAATDNYNSAGLRLAGYVQGGTLVQTNDGASQIAWTTDQIEAAVAAADCGTLANLHEYVSMHGEIEHDGPLANYTQYQLTRLGRPS